MTRAVAEALKAAQIPDGDKAAVALVRRYAFLLDEVRGEDAELERYNDLGPKLLAALTALGMTAAGRGTKGGGSSAAPVASKLDELRQRREQRSGRARFSPS